MKLRDAMLEALKRTNTPPNVIEFAMSFADVMFPPGSVASLRDIEARQEEACIKRLAEAVLCKNADKRQAAFDFCYSKIVDLNKN